MTTLTRFKCVPRCFGPINMDICKLMLCAIEYAYFTGQILHEHAADFQKRKPFEVGCNKFLLFWHVLLNWYVELYYFPILINFPKLNDKFRRKKSSHVKPKNCENRFCLHKGVNWRTGKNSKNSLGKAFSWGHSLAAGRYGISYACWIPLRQWLQQNLAPM